MRKECFFILMGMILFNLSTLYSQVTIGSGSDPDEDAILDLISNESKGLLLPRLSLVDATLPDPLSKHTAGMVVFNTGETIAPGYYYNDGEQWVLISDSDSAPWRNADTNEAATSNTDNIYQDASVGIGTNAINSNAQLDVSSVTKGVLLPRMTTAQRNAIPAELANGLLIYNTSTNCFNYYNTSSEKWVSLCGDYEPAQFGLADCNGGPNGTYRAGTPLNTTNTYTINVRVTEPGTYQVLLTTSNGYSFSKSGTYIERGTYTIDLDGSGVPVNAALPGNEDQVQIYLNGRLATNLPCALPGIAVEASTVQYDFGCASGELASYTVAGDYKLGTFLDGTNYVTIPITVTNPGTAIIETTSVNGMSFSSGSVNLTTSTTSVILYGEGTPQSVGTFQFSPSGTNCTFAIAVTSDIGSFANPANSCYEIYTKNNNNAPDGEYWIKRSATDGYSVKTLCDMTNGGYTLIWSYSEYTARNTYGSSSTMSISSMSNVALVSNNPLQVVQGISTGTEPTTAINYYNYRLPKTAMSNAKASTMGEYRVRIAYNPTNMNDAWGNQNYFSFYVTSGNYDPIDGNTTTSNNYTYFPLTGKIFGFDYSATTNSNPTSFNGGSGGSRGNFYRSNTYGTHWNIGSNIPTQTLTQSMPTDETGSTTTNVSLNPGVLNNAFGFHGETEVNHHFGKCAQAGDDFSFSTNSCAATARYPHSFNGGQGRVLQWWVR